MRTHVLLPGAGGEAWYWHRVVRLLPDAIAVDIPASDDSAGLYDYADAVVEAIGDRGPVVVVAQSMAGLYAPLLCDRVDVEGIVLVCPMIPTPGETGGAWFSDSGRESREEVPFDPMTLFFHD